MASLGAFLNSQQAISLNHVIYDSVFLQVTQGYLPLGEDWNFLACVRVIKCKWPKCLVKAMSHKNRFCVEEINSGPLGGSWTTAPSLTFWPSPPRCI